MKRLFQTIRSVWSRPKGRWILVAVAVLIPLIGHRVWLRSITAKAWVGKPYWIYTMAYGDPFSQFGYGELAYIHFPSRFRPCAEIMTNGAGRIKSIRELDVSWLGFHSTLEAQAWANSVDRRTLVLPKDRFEWNRWLESWLNPR